MAAVRKQPTVAALGSGIAVILILAGCGTPSAPPTAPKGATPVASATAAPISTQAPTSQGEFKTAEEIIPAGLAQAYPLLDKYHSARLPRPSQAKPKYGGTLKVPMVYDPSNWDPFTGNIATYVWGNAIYSNLVRADLRLSDELKGKNNLKQLVAECDVCESWKVTSPTQFTFKIRPDVRWQNIAPLSGRALTAEDIKFSYDKYIDPKAFQQYGIFQSVQSIEAPDSRTLVINLKFPHAGFVDAITHPAFYIFSKEAYDREGGLKVKPPLGSGFMALEEQVPQTRMSLTRSPTYWKKDEFGQQLPYLDRIELTFMPQSATQVAAFRTGQSDTIMMSSWDLASDLLRTEKLGQTSYLHVQESNTNATGQGMMQNRKAPFNDVRVRRALNLALDRPEIIKRAYSEGYCSPGPIPTWWMGLEYPRACKDMGQWMRYDPTQARTLLKDAGFDESHPLTFDLIASGAGGAAAPTTLAKIQSEQEYWKAVGVIANIKQLETTAGQTLNRSGTWEGIYVGGVGVGTDLDAFAQKVHTGGPENFSGINDPEIDKLVDAQRGEFDIQKRRALGAQISERLHDQAWYVLDASSFYEEFTRPYMQNWVSHDLYYLIHGWGAFAIEYTWFDK